jgi:RimJ/RimL family protein N-acetyltransferase
MTLILETERLKLTVSTMENYDDLLALRTDSEVMSCAVNDGPEFGTGKIQTPEQVKDNLSRSEGYYNDYGLGFFCAYEKDTGDFIGQAGLFHWCYKLDQPDIELAYRFFKRYWGKGYGTELAMALIDWGLNVKNLSKIIAPVHPDNIRSSNILKKIGMQYAGKIEHKGLMLDNYVIERK